MTCRRFRPTDAEAVRALHEMALRHTGAFAEGAEAELWDQDLADIPGVYLQPGGEFLVVVIDGRTIAMGGLRLAANNRAEIKRLRVHPDHQRRGVGRRLLTRLEAHAVTTGVSTLALDTSTAQTAARRLFASAGYAESHREHRAGLEMIFMEKQVTRMTVGDPARPSAQTGGAAEPFTA